MMKELFEDAKMGIESAGLKILEAGCSPERFGSWHIIVENKPLLRLLWDREAGWLVLEEELPVALNGPLVWRDIWIGQNPDAETLGMGIGILANKCRGG